MLFSPGDTLAQCSSLLKGLQPRTVSDIGATYLLAPVCSPVLRLQRVCILAFSQKARSLASPEFQDNLGGIIGDKIRTELDFEEHGLQPAQEAMMHGSE